MLQTCSSVNTEGLSLNIKDGYAHVDRLVPVDEEGLVYEARYEPSSFSNWCVFAKCGEGKKDVKYVGNLPVVLEVMTELPELLKKDSEYKVTEKYEFTTRMPTDASWGEVVFNETGYRQVPVPVSIETIMSWQSALFKAVKEKFPESAIIRKSE
jgi:hypothetical protein